MAERVISQAIKNAEVELRSKYKILNYQDALGFIIFLGSLAGIALVWTLYFAHSESYAACILCILIIAIFISFFHELEHDLIHNMYFKKHTWIQDVMFFVIWVAKLHGNPWFRRELHLKHHIVSGQIDDAEERLIGLGLPFGLERLAATLHPFGSLIVTPAIARDAKWLDVKRLNLTSAPVAFLFFGLSKLWLLYVFTMLFVGYDQYHHYLPASQWWWIRAAAVLMCLPNILRQSCLVLMSNCSHYYGDIPEKSVLYQNQILDHWMLFPFQLFCVNFGATHIVHHYVPGQPFYIRELVYRRVKELMISKGVRINDFGIVSRANRYYDANTTPSTVLPADEKLPLTRSVSPNNSHMDQMLLWIGVCCTFGIVSYVVLDQWTTVALGRRIVHKYIYKTKLE